MLSYFLEYIIAHKEWIFSGIGVPAVSFAISIVISLFLSQRKKLIESITIYQENNEIKALNTFENSIEINLCSISFSDINIHPRFKRKDSLPLYVNKQLPVRPHESITLFKIDQMLIDLVEDYVKDRRRIFEISYPNEIFSCLLGAIIRIDYNIVGKRKVKRLVINRMFSVNSSTGFRLSKSPYGKNSYLPKDYILRQKLKNFISIFKNPLAWVKNRKSKFFARAICHYEYIQYALFYKTITEKEATKELKLIERRLDKHQREKLIEYINKR